LLLRFTANTPITVTCPQDSDATWAVGIYVDLKQCGTGQITVVAGTGATLNIPEDLVAVSRGQHCRIGLQKEAANNWSIFGDMEAA
jgi:hypothetical protein